MTREERKDICRQFFTLLTGYSDEKAAKMLDVSTRSVARQRVGQSIPNEATAERMRALLEEARIQLGMTEAERAIAQEEARSARERYQRKMPHRPIDGLDQKQIPAWFDEARRRIESFEYDTAYILLVHRVQDESDFRAIPDGTKAYVLSSFAICCHYTGRQLDGIEYDLKAVAEAEKNGNSTVLLKTIYSNMAGSQLRLGLFEAAIGSCEKSLSYDRSWHYSLHNAVCAMSLLQDNVGLARWLGRWESMFASDYDLDTMREICQDLETDEDLRWARRQDHFRSFLDRLNGIVSSASRQMNGADTAP